MNFGPQKKTAVVDRIPDSVFDCGGVIGDIMSYNLKTSYRPNIPLAYAGALAFMSMITARRFRDEKNGRTPLYIIGTGDSGIGKQAARSTNEVLAKKIEMYHHVYGSFRSGEAIEDYVLTKSRVLCQYDEIDTMFNMLKDGRSATTEVMMGKILDLWSDQGGFTKRRLLAQNATNAKVSVPSVCFHPGFCLYGTAVTQRFAESISDRMKTNGLFARMLIVEAGPRSPQQDFTWCEPDTELIRELKAIAGYEDGVDCDKWRANNPASDESGTIIRRDAKAVEAFREFTIEADSKYDPCEDGASNSLWSRAMEKVSKVAMILAVSRDPYNPLPVIESKDVVMAKDFVWGCTSHSLAILNRFAFENDYQKQMNKIREYLRGKDKIGHSWLLRHLHMSAKVFADVITTMMESGIVNGEDIDKDSGLAKYYMKGEKFDD